MNPQKPSTNNQPAAPSPKAVDGFARPTPMPIPAPAPQPVLPTPPPSPVSFTPAQPQPADAQVEKINEQPQQSSQNIDDLAARQQRTKKLKGFASFLLFIGGVVAAVVIINLFIFQSYYVDGTSMTPTLQNDDRLIIDKVEKTVANVQGHSYIPERGQIVVLDSSIIGVGGREEQLIKRAIGLPGDTVIINDGVVTIKNKDHPEGFNVDKELGLNLDPTYIDAPLELTIPNGQVFVMGDNRKENGSYDSRAFGPIEADKIVGRLWARILPIDKAKIF